MTLARFVKLGQDDAFREVSWPPPLSYEIPVAPPAIRPADVLAHATSDILHPAFPRDVYRLVPTEFDSVDGRPAGFAYFFARREYR